MFNSGTLVNHFADGSTTQWRHPLAAIPWDRRGQKKTALLAISHMENGAFMVDLPEFTY
jgi:hypothetical protein